MMNNLGILLYILIGILGLTVIVRLPELFGFCIDKNNKEDSNCLSRLLLKIRNKIVFNTYLRFFLENYIELFMFSTIY